MKISLGCGVIYLTAAQITAFLVGYAIHIFLGRYLGPAEYGIYGVIISLITSINVFLVTGIQDATSKYIAENDKYSSTIRNKSLKIQGIISLIVFIIYFASAQLIAKWLNDPGLVKYIRLSSLLIPFYGIFSVSAGYLNGKHYFHKQAWMAITLNIIRFLMIFVLVVLGFSVFGAITGFIASFVLASFMGLYFSRDKKKQYKFPTRKLITFGIPVTISVASLTFILNSDLLFVKSIISDNLLTGLYTAASAISMISYHLLNAFAIVLLPALSYSTAINANERSRKLITQVLRFILIILIPTTLLLASTSKNLVSFLYSYKYADAYLSLSILAFGAAFLTIFFIFIVALNAIGKPKISMFITFSALLLMIILNCILIPPYKLGGAALSKTLTAFVAMIAAGIFVYRKFGVLIQLKSIIKIVIPSLFISLIAVISPISGYGLLVEYLLLFAFYFVLLILLKELGKDDFYSIKINFLSTFFKNMKEPTSHKRDLEK